jgi:hypothetical protein
MTLLMLSNNRDHDRDIKLSCSDGATADARAHLTFLKTSVTFVMLSSSEVNGETAFASESLGEIRTWAALREPQ